MATWTREMSSLLIELYSSKPCLYMVTGKYYHDKAARLKCLEEIAETLSIHRPGTTALDVKNKINGLRTQFASEHNKVILRLKNSCDPLDIYTPKLWCYKQLSFLKNNVYLKKTASNIHEQLDLSEMHGSGEETNHLLVTEAPENTMSDGNNQLVINLKPEAVEEMYLESESLSEDPSYSKNMPPITSSRMCRKRNRSLDKNAKCKTDKYERLGHFVASEARSVTNEALYVELKRTLLNTVMDYQQKQIDLNLENEGY